jgi:hypothetical protein
MGAINDLWIEILNNVDSKILSSRRKKFWVFRRYYQEQPDLLSGKYKTVKELPSPESWPIKESFALHFVEPFKTRKQAEEAIKQAKLLQSWQEFIILT